MTADDQRVKPNSVVQIAPESDERFGGCLLVVTEVRTWGVQGYVNNCANKNERGLAYYRANWADIEYVGEAQWIVP